MRVHVVGLGAMLLVAAAPTGSDREPGGYAVRLRVVPAPGGGVQRVALPAAALAAIRNRDGTDIRIFDARDRLVPIARTVPAALQRRDELSVLPILGSQDTRMGARVSVRLDDRGQARVAEVESRPASSGGVVTVVGALLDARTVAGSAERVDFSADVPAGQPVRFSVEASRDLDSWRPLGERVVYRAPGAARADVRIALDSVGLARDYLRITWRATSPLIAPVTLRSAVLLSRAPQKPVLIPARAPGLVDDHTLDFLAPRAALASLRIVPTGGDGPTPIRILGRNEAEEPWTVLASGIAAADRTAIDLETTTLRIVRIEADRRGYGFAASPRLELGFAPQAVAFLASGTGPFTLTAGRAGAADVFTAIETLGGSSDLLAARVLPDEVTQPLALTAPDDTDRAHLHIVLWTVLLGAVALLGGLVWFSWRKKPRPA